MKQSIFIAMNNEINLKAKSHIKSKNMVKLQNEKKATCVNSGGGFAPIHSCCKFSAFDGLNAGQKSGSWHTFDSVKLP